MANVSSNFNLTTLSTRDLESHLKCAIECENNIVIIGRRGSGKTVISKSVIKDLGYDEIYLNLSVLEKPDLAGYPNFFSKSERKYVEYLMPSFYKALIEGNRPCVALLDEVDKAESSLWAPLLEFTQFHSINGSPLPNLKAVIMTGNLQAEGGARPSLPLMDRAEAYLLETTHTLWLDWAASTGIIHPSVTAFIADHPEELFGDVDPGDIYKDPSPRGWESSSKVVRFGESHGWKHNILSEKVSGYVGKKAGLKYSAYFDHYQVLLPLVKRIMSGDKIKSEFEKLEPSKQMVVCMITCARLARQLDELKVEDHKQINIKPTTGFLRTVDPEMALISVRSHIGYKRAIAHKLDEEENFSIILKELTRRINA